MDENIPLIEYKKEETEPVKLVMVTSDQRQRFLMNSAMVAMETNAREFEPKLDNLSLLISIVGWDSVEEYCVKTKQKYSDVKDRIHKLKRYVTNMIAYFSDIDKKIVQREDITSKRFMKYREGLSYFIDHLFFIDELVVFLLDSTDLKNMTIPSNYWYLLSQKYKEMPKENIESAYPTVDEIQESIQGQEMSELGNE